MARLGLSAAMLLGGESSELIELERKAGAKLDVETRRGDAPATAAEQLVTHGGEVALSATAGLAYAAAVHEETDGVRSGAAFGLAFFVAAHELAGPLFGVTPPPRRERPARAVQHPVVHALFGITTALLARATRHRRGLSRPQRP